MVRNLRCLALFVSVLLFLFALRTTPVFAQGVQKGPRIIYAGNNDTSPPFREMPVGREDRAKPLAHRRPGRPHVDGHPDVVLQSSTEPQVSTTNGLNFGGIGSTGFAPPDANASVGATQVVETVNLSYQVFDKSTGASIFGPVSIGNLWTGYGGVCETGNLSDPVVLYDKAAGRWVIGIVAFDSTFSNNAECVAVSTTSDATGSFNRYGFLFGSDLNDYTKLSVWPDGYYLSANIFPSGTFFAGPAACALDRTAMLAGNTATGLCFQLGTSDASLLPSDSDGSTAPPAGSPNFFLELGTSSTLNLYKFHVDFANSNNTTLTGPMAISVPPYTDACGGSGGTCIPQPGTTQQLDSLGERLMFRVAYRNFGSHESLVTSHSISSGNSTAVRWYEIRSPNGTPAAFQSGTFAPNATSRWMPSVAMDQAGDIALGYSLSSSSVFPSIAYTGRVPSDAPGTMESETMLLSGSGSQTGGLSRWGDYTSMAIDPVDDCTFWYSNEYLSNTGSFNWATRLASFRFPTCGSTSPDFTVAATPSSQSVTQANSTTYTATIGAVNGFTGTVSLSVTSGLPAGASANFSPTSVTGSGNSTLTVSTASTTPAGTYTLTITGSSGSTTHSTTVTLIVNSASSQDFSVSASPSSGTVTAGSSTSYTATVASSGGFTGSVSLSVSGLPSGANATFSTNPIGGGSGTSTMSVTTSGSTPTGNYTLKITGTSGSITHSTTVTLVVNSFSISATPPSQTVTRGNSTAYTVTATAVNGFNGSVTFRVRGLPFNSTATFNPSSVTSQGTSTLTISTNSSTSTGTFSLRIRGTSGSVTHSTTVQLVVQ